MLSVLATAARQSTFAFSALAAAQDSCPRIRHSSLADFLGGNVNAVPRLGSLESAYRCTHPVDEELGAAAFFNSSMDSSVWRCASPKASKGGKRQRDVDLLSSEFVTLSLHQEEKGLVSELSSEFNDLLLQDDTWLDGRTRVIRHKSLRRATPPRKPGVLSQEERLFSIQSLCTGYFGTIARNRG